MEKQLLNEPREGNQSFVVIAAVVAILIIVIWVLFYFALRNDTDRGTFGDMFGGVNALFSGFALAGIILTILLQRKELHLQRKELKDTRKEFSIQNQTLKLQRFENTFFNLLSLHHRIVNTIDFTITKKRTTGPKHGEKEAKTEVENFTGTGRDVFRNRYNMMLPELQKAGLNPAPVYLHYYTRLQSDLGHYFRNLYRIIKLVD